MAVGGFAAIIGFDRERAFYATVLILIASYYVLFAAMGGSGHTLAMESVVGGRFLVFAVIGFKTNFWLIVAALIGHGIFDFVHRFLIDNPGVPHWWPGSCLTFDASLGVFLAVRRIRHLVLRSITIATLGKRGSMASENGVVSDIGTAFQESICLRSEEANVSMFKSFKVSKSTSGPVLGIIRQST